MNVICTNCINCSGACTFLASVTLTVNFGIVQLKSPSACAHVHSYCSVSCNVMEINLCSLCNYVPLCACMQSPYDIMLHGCNVVEGGTRTMTVINDLQISSAFVRQLPLLTVTSNIGHAVSVQTSSGTIVGCGRFETLFPVDVSYRGKVTFSQFIFYFPAILADVSNSDILQYNILEGIAGTCSSKAAIFDPWNPPGTQVGSQITADQFPVGDLPHHTLEVFSLLPEVPLIGSATVIGHAVCCGLQSYLSMHKILAP